MQSWKLIVHHGRQILFLIMSTYPDIQTKSLVKQKEIKKRDNSLIEKARLM
jgi:hypothetical protein